tara:strand:- start:259 stop:666 length:408 start_codon:yes stop_codon:yes gene_type:complete
MIIDYENEFSDAQAVTNTAVSTNYIDFGDAKDHSKGNPLMLEVVVETACTSGGSAVVTVALESDTTTTITPDKSQALATAIPVATLVAGYVVYRGAITEGLLRYAQIKYTVATADLTAGTFSARIVEAFQSNVSG